MTRPVLLSALCGSILLSALAQLLLKMGMSAAPVQRALADPSVSAWDAARHILLSPMVLAGLLVFAASAGVWLLVLARVELSTAYPFVALGIVLTTMAGVVLLGETVTVGKIAGIGLIVCGVAVLGIAALQE